MRTIGHDGRALNGGTFYDIDRKPELVQRALLEPQLVERELTCVGVYARIGNEGCASRC